MKPGYGKKIREARKAARLSQQRLGKKIGVSRATVWGWETEKYELDPLNAVNLTRTLLTIKLEDVLTDEQIAALRSVPTDQNNMVRMPITVEAAGFAMLWEQLPPDNDVRGMVERLIKAEHERLFPDYWKARETPSQRPARKGFVKPLRNA